MHKRKISSHKHAPQARSGISASSALPFGVPAGVALIAVVAFIVYFPCVSGGFLLDDDLYLTQNQIIKAANGLWRFWCTTEASDYWPASNTTLWIEWRLWEMNPTGYHVTNLLLHIAEALLIWIILRKLSIPAAFLAAVIFALHPVNVESVAWIAQRKDMLAVLFFLLSILFYLKLEIPCPLFYWLSLITFLLAMLSKGSAAVLPVLLLGIVWWQRKLGTVPIFVSTKMGLSPSVPIYVSTKTGLSPSISQWDLVRIAPFFAIAMVLAVVNLWFQTHGTQTVYRTAGFLERLFGAGGVVWFYLYKAILPCNLIFVYPQWQIKVGNPLWWLPLMAALAVTAVLWRRRKGWSRPLLFAWVFFCAALVPVMGLTDMGFMQFSLVADHYQHIAIIGVIALAAAGFGAWRQRAQGKAIFTAIAIVMAAVGTLAFLTSRQSRLYGNPILLYQATLEKNSDCWMVHNNLGGTLFGIGRVREAIGHYQQALRLNPDYPDALNNLSIALVETGRPQEAIKHCEQALRLKPNFPEAEYNLGNAFKVVNQYQQAIEHYEKALQFKADYPEAHNNLGLALTNVGRPQEAIEHYLQALRLKPDFPEAYYNLGSISFYAGQLQQAVEHYQKALQFKPNYPEAHNNLGVTLVQIGRAREAIEHYQQALRLKPDLTTAYSNLAAAYASMHQSAAAVAAAEKAIELAQSQGQTALAKQIEDWLNSYLSSLPDIPNPPP